MGTFSRYAATVITTVALAGGVQAQSVDAPAGRLLAQATPTVTDQPPAPTADLTPAMQAMQIAINTKDVTAIFNLLNATPRNERGPLVAQLLAAAQSLAGADKQFAASLAALAIVSGGLTAGQQNAAVSIVRNAPGGLAIVGALLANNTTGGFGFSTVGIAALITTENPNLNSNVPTPTPTGSQS